MSFQICNVDHPNSLAHPNLLFAPQNCTGAISGSGGQPSHEKVEVRLQYNGLNTIYNVYVYSLPII